MTHYIVTKDEDFEKLIKTIVRIDLDEQDSFSASPPILQDLVKGMVFVRIMRISAFWKQNRDEESISLLQNIEDFVTGLHGVNNEWIFLIKSFQKNVECWIGIKPDSVHQKDAYRTINSILYGTLLDVRLNSLSGHSNPVSINVEPIIDFKYRCLLTGIPSLKNEQHDKINVKEERIEKLCRGLYGKNWIYTVHAVPINPKVTWQNLLNIAKMIKDYVPFIEKDTSWRLGKHYIKLLERNHERFEIGRISGMWDTQTLFFTDASSTLNHAQALLKNAFSGKHSTPEPIRTCQKIPMCFEFTENYFNELMTENLLPKKIIKKLKCIEKYKFKNEKEYLSILKKHLGDRHADNYQKLLLEYLKNQNKEIRLSTELTSKELSILACPPTEEYPGYEVVEYTRFGVQPNSFDRRKAQHIYLGEIYDRGRESGHSLVIPHRDLTKHGLIVGVTGSGKTTTCFSLLTQIYQDNNKVPFLVIESAKTEYRSLLTSPLFDEVNIFTIGDENLSPLRLNPFEVPEPSKIRVQTHID